MDQSNISADSEHKAGQPSSLLNDGKAPGAMRTIGEVARALDIKQHVLRYWEQQFPSLRPLQRSGGRRYYRSEDIALIERINHLINREGYTVKGARKLIEDGGDSGVAVQGANAQGAAAQSASSDIRLRAQLQAIRTRLAKALDAA